MRTLAEDRSMAGKEEESGGIGLMGEGVMALMVVVALCLAVGLRVGVAEHVLLGMFVHAVKLVGRALRVVQEVRVWSIYL